MEDYCERTSLLFDSENNQKVCISCNFYHLLSKIFGKIIFYLYFCQWMKRILIPLVSTITNLNIIPHGKKT